MNAKTVISLGLAWTLCCAGAVRAQTPPITKGPLESAPPPSSFQATGNPGGYAQDSTPGPHPTQAYHLSPWITGDKYSCCGNEGCNGPVLTELFFRTGPAIPIGNGTVADVMQTGLYLGAGGRSLFFDPCMTKAWTLELGLTNISNHCHFPNTYSGIPLNILVPQNPATPVTPPDSTGNLPPQRVFFGRNGVPGVHLRAFNRTFFDIGGGHEWYLWGAANCGGGTWRIGCDVGGRWGSGIAEFEEIRHRVDVMGGAWAAAHTDVDIPCGGCCIFQAGLRIAYDYTWSDILQIQNHSDVQDISILFNFGVRF